jgi:hypothetical protein
MFYMDTFVMMVNYDPQVRALYIPFLSLFISLSGCEAKRVKGVPRCESLMATGAIQVF